jgi:hypothetical protein
MLNITQIPAPRVDLIDPVTGLMSREWFRFFNNIYTIVGANLGVTQIVNGGTGLSTLPTNGQLLIGNSGEYKLNTLTSGAGITVTNGAGTITLSINATGVVAGTYGLANKVGKFTVNAQGQITTASNINIAIDASQIISGTMTGIAIENCVIGASTPAAGTFTTATATKYVGISGGTF